MMLLLSLIVIGLIIAVVAGNYASKFLSQLLLLMGVRPLSIGIILSSCGAMLPEIAIAIVALALYGQQSGYLIVGLSLGTSIVSMLFIIGLCALFVRNIDAKWDMLRIDIPLLIAIAAIALFTFRDGKIIFIEAILLLLSFGVYVWYMTSIARKDGSVAKVQHHLPTVLFLVIALIALGLGSYMVVRGTMQLASALMHPHSALLAMLLLPLGTGVVRAFNVLRALRQQQQETAMGLVLGSIAVSLLLIPGVAALVHTLAAPSIEIPALFLGAGIAVYTASMLNKRVSRYEGMLLIILYLLFLSALL